MTDLIKKSSDTRSVFETMAVSAPDARWFDAHVSTAHAPHPIFIFMNFDEQLFFFKMMTRRMSRSSLHCLLFR